MDENTARLFHQLKNDPSALRSLMTSQDGQALMQMLTQKDRGAGLQKAVQSAARGNTADMARMIQQLMQSPDGAALVQRINQSIQKSKP